MSSNSSLMGGWDVVGRTFNEMQRTIDKVGDEPMKQCAEAYLEKLKSKMAGQEFPWTPLSASYVAYKKKKGLDSRMLIATGEYLEKLKVGKSKGTSKGASLFVGADPSDIHTPSGLSMEKIAGIMEYGSSNGNIPARPHFRPTWEEMRPVCRNMWLKVGRDFCRWR